MPEGNAGGVFLRFTIRDLMSLTLVVGLAFGWWITCVSAARARRDCEWRFWRLAQYIRTTRGEHVIWNARGLYIQPDGGTDHFLLSREGPVYIVHSDGSEEPYTAP